MYNECGELQSNNVNTTVLYPWLDGTSGEHVTNSTELMGVIALPAVERCLLTNE